MGVVSLVFTKTFGCTLNQENTKEVTINCDITPDIRKAKYILVNTCGVKEQTQTKVLRFLKYLKKENIPSEKIYIFGCLVTIDPESMKKILPNANYFKISENHKLKKIIEKKDVIKIRKEITKTIIIANGCLGNCSYCAVKFARGTLKSKKIKDIKKEVEISLENGTKEILLTAQDTACYGFDINTNLVELLKELITIDKDFKIRVGMGNPQHLLRILDDLIEVYKSNKIYSFLHIPIQSGDNDVLKKMNRYYIIEDAIKIINKFRKNIPNITIATDIIVGFPTETNEQFQNTIKVVKKIKPDIINISRFGRRKNIEANKYPDLSGTIKKERSRELTKLTLKISYENNLKFENKIKDVLFLEPGKNNTVIGRTDEYKLVVLSESIKLPQILKTKIIKAHSHYLISKIN